MKKIYFLVFGLLLLLNVPQKGWGQISVSSTTPVTENFDGMGTSTTTIATLPANWVIAGTATPTYSSGSNVTTQFGVSSGSPTTGGTYNWGNGTTITDRALGAMTSGTFASPNSIIAFYKNTNALASIASVSVSYDLEQYRINTAAASVQFYYSTDGSTWTAVAGGTIATITTGANTYTFATPAIFHAASNPFVVTFATPIAVNGNFYLRWNLNTTGANSQGIGIDNVSVTAAFSNTISTSAISGSPFCVSPLGVGNFGATVNVPYTIAGTYLATNTFTAQLSDASGSFAAPVNIGTLTNTNTSGTIAATIPAATAAGTGYRIQVISSNPATASANIIPNTVDQTVNVFNAPTSLSADHGDFDAQAYWVNPACFSDVMVVASSSAFTAALPTGDGSAYTASLDYTSGASSTFDGGKVVYRGSGVTTGNIFDLTNFTFYNIKIYTRGGPTGTTWVAGATVTTEPQPPVITISTTTITGFNYVIGSGPSNASLTTYTVAGSNLLSNISLNAPTDYEISTDDVTFGSTITLIEDVSNNVAATTIYVRLKAGLAVGNYNSEIVAATATNASTKNLSCSGTVYKVEPTNYPTSFAGNCASVTTSSIPLTWTDAAGGTVPDGYLIKWSSVGYSSIVAPVDGVAEATGTYEQNVAQGIGTFTPSSLHSDSTYYFEIFPYTNSGTNINYKTNVTIPTASCTTLDIPCLTEGFNAGTVAPAGWTFTGTGFSTYTTATNFGAASPALQFNTTGQQVKTITLSAGSSAYILSFWLKGQTATGSSFLVEGFNGTSWVTIQNITSIPNTGTTFVYNFTGSSPALPANLTQFRFTYNKVTSNVGFDDVSVYCTTNCSSPDAIAFVQQPSNVLQGSAMSPAVTVKAYCIATGNTATSFTGAVTLTAAGGGCGYISQTVNAVNGIATFNNIIFTRSPQSGITLQASASSITASVVTSNTFNITAPGGSPTNTTIATNDFEGAGTWAYTFLAPGAATYGGVGGVNGGDQVTIKNFGGNNSLVKSYTADNASGQIRSTNTITFANQTGLASYSYTTFSFQVGSLGTGTGAGADGGDNMNIDISLDGGTTWNTLLTYYGNSDYLFPLSATSPVSLTYDANASYVKASTQSAFNVVLPFGTSQFRFRMTATNNRTEENWAIDNVSLVGTTIPAGVSNALPTATGNAITTCPGTATSISIATANTVGAVTYAWTPVNGTLSSTTIANPVVTISSSATYTCTVTDADKCSTSATVLVTIPSGSAGSWTGATNNDWFECTNWGNGVVPTSAVNVTVPTSPTNSSMIDPTSTFATPFSGIASANNITNNQTISLQSGALLNVAGNLTNAATGLVDMTNGGTIDLKGNWTNNAGTGGFTAGTGKVSFSGTAIEGITTAGSSESFYDLTINNTGSGVVMNNDINVADITALTAGPLLINGKTLTLNGVVTTGTGTLSGSSTSNVTIGNTGSTNPTLNFTSGSQLLHNLTLNSSALATLGTSLSITAGSSCGTDSVANGAILTTNDNLTLKSDINGTARVAQNTSGSTYITGNVTVERYIQPNHRAWRLLTAPISSAETIKNSWQEGQSNTTNGSGRSNTVPGYGTEITDLLSTNPLTSGYDSAVTNNPSILYLNSTATSWVAPANTNSTNVNSQQGFMLFVRGDRSVQVKLAPFNAATATTLRTIGTLKENDQSIPIAGTNFRVVGNPYASGINFNSIYLSNSAKTGDIYYLWDPLVANAQGVGGFVTFVSSGSGTYSSTTPVSSFDLNGRIESGAAFVMNFSGTGTLSIPETAKVPGTALVFRPADNTPSQSFRADLYSVEPDNTVDLDDGTLTLYDSRYSDSVSWLEDAKKLSNISENLSLERNGQLLAIEKRQPIVMTDTIFLSIKNMRQQQIYQFAFAAAGLDQPGLIARLEDKFLNISTPISLTDTTKINFTVTGDAASQGVSRFRIVFQTANASPLAVTFIDVRVSPQANNSIGVEWKVANQLNIKQYDIEKSTDGYNFTKVNTTTAILTGQSSIDYNWIDNNTVIGYNYYRIKSVSDDGTLAYSKIVKIKMEAASQVSIYPDPIINGMIGLQFINMPNGNYNLRILDISGKELMKQSVIVSSPADSKKVILSKSFSKGIYQLEIIGPDNSRTTLKMLNY